MSIWNGEGPFILQGPPKEYVEEMNRQLLQQGILTPGNVSTEIKMATLKRPRVKTAKAGPKKKTPMGTKKIVKAGPKGKSSKRMKGMYSRSYAH